MQINQFHSGISVGDAITNQMLLIQSLLKKNGYDSEIFAEHIPENMQTCVKPILSYSGSKKAILLIHHSMGIDCFEHITKLNDRKILIYHNITPEYFFEDDQIRRYVRIGIKQVMDYKHQINYCIADSNYNRQELMHIGYKCYIDVMPVQISLDRLDKVIENDHIISENSDVTNFIFVGRVVWNKRQDDVIKSFAVYNRYYNSNSKLFIIGDNSAKSYIEDLKNLIKILKVEDAVVFTGKVSEEDLKAYYKIADFFLCMSEHEGFGVPLLEAMKMGVPVLAYRSSAVPETMDGAGILVLEKNYAYIGTLLYEILNDKQICDAIIQKQFERIERLENTNTEKILLDAVKNLQNQSRMRSIQIQGPFETSYSLAVINRKLIENLDDLPNIDASIFCTEGTGDYIPNAKDLKDKHHAEALWKKSESVIYPDIAIRNMYPPKGRNVKGGLNFQFFGWEESVIPRQYIEDFNRNLSGIGTISDYVTEKLIESGIKIPVKTVGCGVELEDDYDLITPYKIKSNKKIKFLHISSAFPRKGIDILLKAFYQAFTNEDDVCLVLKTFPNPHNNVSAIIEILNRKYPNPPMIEWINQDLPAKDLFGLYKMADCYVHVARGEGFGLPVAEAMLARVPVIVCPNSGMADFCNLKTALLVDYKLRPAHTHIQKEDSFQISMWAEPDVDSLVEKLQMFVEGVGSDRFNMMTEEAHRLIAEKFSWKCVVNRWMDFINEVEKDQRKPKVAMVTTWNNRCGIAEYTKMAVEASSYYVDYQIYPNYGADLLKKDEPFVKKRLWHSAYEGSLDVLAEELIRCNSDIIHFQFNYGFFELMDLARAIKKIVLLKPVVITFHKTVDSDVGGKIVSLRRIVEALNMCSALVVHQRQDQEYLVRIGIKEQLVYLIRHGQVVYPEIAPEYRKKEFSIKSSFVIGSYGFLLPHKGIKEVIQAVAELKKTYPDVLYMPICALHESDESKEYLKECLIEAEKLEIQNHVRFITDYLQNDQSMRYLQTCDLMIMPYKPTQESASGAIRFCLSALRPTITTKQSIFNEFKECTYQIERTDKNEIIKAIQAVTDVEVRERLIQSMKQDINNCSWYNTAKELYGLYRKLI